MKQRCGQSVDGSKVPPLTSCPEGLNPVWCARYLALAPGGPMAKRFLAPQNVVMQVKDSFMCMLRFRD